MGIKDVEDYQKEKSRTNGWSLPPHPLQFIAWCIIIVFCVIHFTTVVPALHKSWQPPAHIMLCICTGEESRMGEFDMEKYLIWGEHIAYDMQCLLHMLCWIPALAVMVHFICHIVACTIDPADLSVLRKKYPKQPFNRGQHKHVIENSHCYICQVSVQLNSKHCSICNKCVSDFDHHCKWLNNCIGGRNYRWFLATLVTAIISLILVALVSLVEFIAYYTDKTDRAILQPYRVLNATRDYTEADFMILYQPVIHQGWLALLGVYCLFDIVVIGLLVHLFGFHLFLIYKHLSTYDYIVQQRDKDSHKDDNDDDDNSIASSSKHSKRNRIMPSSDLSLKENKKFSSLDLQKSNVSSVTVEFQKILEKAEAQRGETPPPSASPIRSQESNNNKMNEEEILEKTAVKKLRKKRKTPLPNNEKLIYSDGTVSADNSRAHQSKSYTLSHINIPADDHPIQIMPSYSMVVTPQAVGAEPEYNSDTADSLLEVPTDKLLTFNTLGSKNEKSDQKKLKKMKLRVPKNTDSQSEDENANKAVRRKKERKIKNDTDTQSVDELNSTTLFKVNGSAKLNPDGSLNYTDGFTVLPLTPTNLRKFQATKVKSIEVPPLDLSPLHGSHESVSFQPYSATFRSTDTINTDRLLSPLKEEKLKSTLKTVVDTEV